MNNIGRFKKPRRNNSHSVDGLIGGPPRGYKGDLGLRRGDSFRVPNRRLDDFSRRKTHDPKGSDIGADKNKHQSARRAADGGFDLDMPDSSAPKKQHSKRSMRRVVMKSFNVVLLVGIISAGYLFGKGYLKALQIFKGGGSAVALNENADPSLLKGEGDGRVNILLLGTGGANYDGGSYLVDTMIVASIDPIHKEAALLSIPRDFYVQVDQGPVSASKINAVYKYARSEHLYKNPKDESGAHEAGMKAMDKTVERTMGIPIHYHAMIDFVGFEKAINTVGGITFNAKNPVTDLMHVNGQPYYLDVKAGRQHFNGRKALMYSRSRKTSPRGDFDRSERQKEVLIALKDKILSVGTLANPLKLNGLLDDFGDHIRTNLSVEELLRVNEIGSGIPSNKITSLSLVDDPNNLLDRGATAEYTLIPRAGMYDYSEIHKFVRNRLQDGYLRSENATVMVLNGTRIAGLAGRTAAELESYGYNISKVADSPIQNQQMTTIVDMRGGEKKYTKAYLEKRFGVSTVSQIPDERIKAGEADFVIILGQNEQNRLAN